MEEPGELNQSNEGSKTGVRKRRRLFWELALDFTKNSTLHGLRYFTARGLTALEKTFWIIIFLISVVLCGWTMSKVWEKWQNSPIIISVDDHLMSASEVPFPAVTVCPHMRIDQDSFNYTEHWITFKIFMHRLEVENVTGEKEVKERVIKFMEETPFMKELVDVNLICNDFQAYEFSQYASAQTLGKNIVQAAPRIHMIMAGGNWRGDVINETDTAQIAPVLTERGLCYTFNGLATDEIFHMDRIQSKYSYLNATGLRKGWSLQHGYFNRTGYDVYPRRGQASGYSSDLDLYLYDETSRDYLCDSFEEGYEVYLHHPADLPQISLHHYTARAQESAYFAIKINVVTTSDSLIKYPPHIRQCYFPSEKSLMFFKAYTSSNCRLECLTNYTLAVCDCIPFHLPRNDSTALCTLRHQGSCVIDALEEYSRTDDGFGNLCHCLPSCYSVHYEAEVIKNYFDTKNFELAEKRAMEKVGKSSERYYAVSSKYTILKMFFKEARFTTLQRSELFGLTDFLANCGGLLGLFLGFSFLSIVELVYFCTLRLACMFRREKEAACKKADHVKIV